jgi:hypothetical protein
VSGVFSGLVVNGDIDKLDANINITYSAPVTLVTSVSGVADVTIVFREVYFPTGTVDPISGVVEFPTEIEDFINSDNISEIQFFDENDILFQVPLYSASSAKPAEPSGKGKLAGPKLASFWQNIIFLIGFSWDYDGDGTGTTFGEIDKNKKAVWQVVLGDDSPGNARTVVVDGVTYEARNIEAHCYISYTYGVKDANGGGQQAALVTNWLEAQHEKAQPFGFPKLATESDIKPQVGDRV